MFNIVAVVGALVGWFIAYIPGAVIGFFVGAYFGRAFKQFNRAYSPEVRAAVEAAFFHAVFPLLGHMAKADGRISESEIASTEQFMDKLNLSAEARKQAIELFKSGAAPEFSLDTTLNEFTSVCGKYADLKQILLVYLISLALADGHIHSAEEAILKRVSAALGYPQNAFEHLLRMAQAQGYFHSEQGAGGRGASENAVAMAYQALGVEADVSDAELKKTYRKLMSQYHPDKLTGQGVPEEMIKVATERSQEIQAAYDLLKEHRAKA